MMVAFVDWAMSNYDRREFIILGNTVKSAWRNVVKPYIAMSYANDKYHLKDNLSNYTLTVSKGGRQNTFNVFGANNEKAYEPIQGMTAAGLLVDEVVLCNKTAFYTALGRLSVSGARAFFNCNPSYPLHWFNTEWIMKAQEMGALYLQFSMDDNPSLDEKTKSRLAKQYSGVFYDRNILGKWVVAEGLVYQFDSPSEYTCTHDEALGDGRGAYYLSIDYGITNPFACLLWRVTPDCAYIVDEYYFASKETGRRRTDAEHYDAMDEFAKDYPIDSIIIDPSATSFKEEIYRRGKYSVRDADNEVLEGIQVTDQMLHDGSIKISETCEHTIEEMQLYRWDDKAAKDAVIKEWDHALDSCRYEANTILKYILKGYA